MQFEIDESIIVEEVQKQLELKAKQFVKEAIGNWGFETQLRSAVKKALDEHVQTVVNDAVADVQTIKSIVSKQLVNSINTKLRRALDMQEKLENEKVSNNLLTHTKTDEYNEDSSENEITSEVHL